MKLLFIGDIVGQPGRRAVKHLVPQLRRQHGLSLVVANGENSAGGSGITVNTAAEIFAAGVDIITSGDHLWDQKEVMGLLEGERRFVRPLNYPARDARAGEHALPGAGAAAGGGPEPARPHLHARAGESLPRRAGGGRAAAPDD